ncbi:MAG: DUF1871 family protein [Oscillospiraceae bacterium]|jgi:hypothetical protein
MLFAAVKKCIDEWDPYGLLLLGAPPDRFDAESRKIAQRIKVNSSAAEIASAVSEVFSKAFYPKDFGKDRCMDVARKIRKTLRSYPIAPEDPLWK